MRKRPPPFLHDHATSAPTGANKDRKGNLDLHLDQHIIFCAVCTERLLITTTAREESADTSKDSLNTRYTSGGDTERTNTVVRRRTPKIRNSRVAIANIKTAPIHPVLQQLPTCVENYKCNWDLSNNFLTLACHTGLSSKIASVGHEPEKRFPSLEDGCTRGFPTGNLLGGVK